MRTPRELRDDAARCRRLADGLGSDAAVPALRDLAVQYEADAVAQEAAEAEPTDLADTASEPDEPSAAAVGGAETEGPIADAVSNVEMPPQA